MRFVFSGWAAVIFVVGAVFPGFWTSGCARAPIQSVDQAMRPTGHIVTLDDDMNWTGLADGLQHVVDRLKAYEAPLGVMRFGKIAVAKDDYIKGLQDLIDSLKGDPSGKAFRDKITGDFDLYEVYGRDDWGDVFITSYYTPEIAGRSKREGAFTQAIYGVPSNMVTVNISEFTRVNPGYAPLIGAKSMVGRLEPTTGAVKTVLPFYSRQEIDEIQALAKQAPVLAWVDPVDAFFLQIQGSGVVLLPEGKRLQVGYAAQNGYPYVPIGKFLFDRIPKEKMTAQRLAAYLRSLPPGEAQALMNQNPSYVFFQKAEAEPRTYFGVDVVPGRTIATDPAYFPKGSVAFLEFQKPVFKRADGMESPDGDAVDWQPTSRFVLDEDVGGAIRGGGRVDLYSGHGLEAAAWSGVMKNHGRLYYIVPKPRH